MNGPIAYTALPRAQFSTLQQAIFPPYFGKSGHPAKLDIGAVLTFIIALQTVLPLILAFTWPGERAASLGTAVVARTSAGYHGLMEESNVWTALLPVAVMCGTSLLNLVVLGPATTKVMRERKHQGEFAAVSRSYYWQEMNVAQVADSSGKMCR